MPSKSTASSQMPYRPGTVGWLQSHPAQHKGIWAKCPERLLHHLTMPGRRACKDTGMGLPELPHFATTQLYLDPESSGRADHGGKPCRASSVTPRHITEPQEIKRHAPTTLSEETFTPCESHRPGDCSVHQTTPWVWYCLAPSLCLKKAVVPHFPFLLDYLWEYQSLGRGLS